MRQGWYPERESKLGESLPAVDERFATAREDYLLGFENYNTARAYWGDLEHLHDWCQHRGFDILKLTEGQFRQYQALLRRRRYSESTIRRRSTAWRGLRVTISEQQASPPEHR